MSRIRRGFNDIKREVEQELHNDAVMQELRETGRQLEDEASGISADIQRASGQPGSQADGASVTKKTE